MEVSHARRASFLLWKEKQCKGPEAAGRWGELGEGRLTPGISNQETKE